MAQEQDAEGNDFTVLAEKSSKLWCQEPEQCGDGQGNCSGHDQGGIGSLFRTSQIAGADVLTYKGCGRLAHTHHRQHNEAVDLGVAAPAGHTSGAEAVDVGLHVYVGEGGDRLLKACRKTDGEDHFYDGHVHAQVFPHEPVVLLAFCEKEQDHERGNKLGDDGCIGNACDSHVECDDEQQVQNDVHDTGKNQEVQRTFGVTDCAEDTASHIIEEKSRYTCKVDAQVGGCGRKYVVRGVHEAEQPRRTVNSDDGAEDAADKCERQSRFHCGVKAFIVVGAEVAADDNRGPEGDAVEECDQRVDDRCGGADGSQRFLADKVADHQAVYGVIQLLEDVAHQQRE